MARVAAVASRAIVRSNQSRDDSCGCHCGRKRSVAFCSIQVAKASFSQISSHSATDTRLPNHWWATSCATRRKTPRSVRVLLRAGS